MTTLARPSPFGIPDGGTATDSPKHRSSARRAAAATATGDSERLATVAVGACTGRAAGAQLGTTPPHESGSPHASSRRGVYLRLGREGAEGRQTPASREGEVIRVRSAGRVGRGSAERLSRANSPGLDPCVMPIAGSRAHGVGYRLSVPGAPRQVRDGVVGLRRPGRGRGVSAVERRGAVRAGARAYLGPRPRRAAGR